MEDAMQYSAKYCLDSEYEVVQAVHPLSIPLQHCFQTSLAAMMHAVGLHGSTDANYIGFASMFPRQSWSRNSTTPPAIKAWDSFNHASASPLKATLVMASWLIRSGVESRLHSIPGLGSVNAFIAHARHESGLPIQMPPSHSIAQAPEGASTRGHIGVEGTSKPVSEASLQTGGHSLAEKKAPLYLTQPLDSLELVSRAMYGPSDAYLVSLQDSHGICRDAGYLGQSASEKHAPTMSPVATPIQGDVVLLRVSFIDVVHAEVVAHEASDGHDILPPGVIL